MKCNDPSATNAFARGRVENASRSVSETNVANFANLLGIIFTPLNFLSTCIHWPIGSAPAELIFIVND